MTNSGSDQNLASASESDMILQLIWIQFCKELACFLVSSRVTKEFAICNGVFSQVFISKFLILENTVWLGAVERFLLALGVNGDK